MLRSLLHVTLLVLLGLQITLAQNLWQIRATKEQLLPPLISADYVNFLSLSDPQFFFRTMIFTIQHTGDLNGQRVPLKDYDYTKLLNWFTLLERLDPDSQLPPLLAGYYFSSTPDPQQIQQIIDYLVRHAQTYPQTKWRWLVHAIYLARHRLHDLPQALKLSYILARLDVPGLPTWTKQMPAFILVDMNDTDAARTLMESILTSDPTLSNEEKSFINSYLKKLPAEKPPTFTK